MSCLLPLSERCTLATSIVLLVKGALFGLSIHSSKKERNQLVTAELMALWICSGCQNGVNGKTPHEIKVLHRCASLHFDPILVSALCSSCFRSCTAVRPDMTFAVDWALKTNYLSYLQMSGPGCTTTSQPIYCQVGRQSTSLVQLSPDALTPPRLGDNCCRATHLLG